MCGTFAKLGRWRIKLSEFEFDIVHSAVIKNQAGDAILRLPVDGTNKTKPNDHIPLLTLPTDTFNTEEDEKMSRPRKLR